jgi:hypothetical protein
MTPMNPRSDLTSEEIISTLTLPPYPISIPIPMDVVTSFRWLSGIGTALFWLLLGSIFLLCWRYYLARQESKQQELARRSPSLAE